MLNILNKLQLLKNSDISKIDLEKIIDQEFLTTRQRAYQVIENLIEVNSFWKSTKDFKYHHLCESDYWIGLDILLREILKDYEEAVKNFYNSLEHSYCHESDCVNCNILTVNVSFIDAIKSVRRVLSEDELKFIKYMRNNFCHYYLSDYGISSRHQTLGRKFDENKVFYKIVEKHNGNTMLLAKELSKRLEERFLKLNLSLDGIKKIKLK